MSKHDAVWAWLQACPHINDLFFNAATAGEGSVQLIPAESVVTEYVDGSSLRSYDCALVRFEPLSFEPNDEGNVRSLADFDRIGEWIEAQNDAGNFPEFPPGTAVQEMTVAPNGAGYMAMLDMGLAKYMIQFQIRYLKG